MFSYVFSLLFSVVVCCFQCRFDLRSQWLTRFCLFKSSQLLSRGKVKNVISWFLISFETSQVEFFLLIVFFIFWPVICSTLKTMSWNLVLYMAVVTGHMVYFSAYAHSDWNISDKYLKSWNDVTIIPSLLEVKFHVFGMSKHGGRKSLCNIFFALLISTLWIFYRANKKNLSYSL